MHWSQMFIPTLREDPAHVEAASHRLLVRGGYIRQLTAGVYSLLPLAQLVRRKIIEIIREEMSAIGGQEFLLSVLQPMELWEESGRKEAVSDIMFHLQDKKGSKLALGLTHEEAFTSIARSSLVSYKQLPQIWYQIQTKFRDETRPKGGLLRVREFTMKDAYSFDLDATGLDAAFEKHRSAYTRIFERCGLKFLAVQANSGAMGGTASVEFMVLTPSGEDTLVLCQACDYAANLERAESKVEGISDDHNEAPLEEFASPGVCTVRDLEIFNSQATAWRQIKSLVYIADGALTLVLVQGDQDVNEAKLQTLLAVATLRQATEPEIVEALGAQPGSLGGCRVKSGETCKVKRIVADWRLRGRTNMFTGANKDNFHLSNVAVARDIAVDLWADLHTVRAGESCPLCNAALKLTKGLEIGHIFKLGTRYSESMNAMVLAADGARKPLLMGSYGIGLERLMAAIVELNHDEKGIVWPLTVAPVHALITCVNSRDSEQERVAASLAEQFQGCAIEYLLDDRDERAGVKFNDGDLIGIPYRITVGKRIKDGQVELFERATLSCLEMPIEKVVAALKEKFVRCG
jgi:prolyl-tRNA synthetase